MLAFATYEVLKGVSTFDVLQLVLCAAAADPHPIAKVVSVVTSHQTFVLTSTPKLLRVRRWFGASGFRGVFPLPRGLPRGKTKTFEKSDLQNGVLDLACVLMLWKSSKRSVVISWKVMKFVWSV
jgi:hypothetical protein